jgi:hypothetical protein
MRLRVIGLGSVVAFAAIATSVWSARYAPWADGRRAAPEPLVAQLEARKEGAARWAGVTPDPGASGAQNPDPSVDARPPLADDAPLPRAVVGERGYEFGSMGIGERKSHTFRIDNQGEGPLLIGRGPTECKCTISKLTNREVPPGRSAEVEIAWTPREPESRFEKSAIIWTNDPRLPEIRFRVAGKVAPPLTVAPLAWHAGSVAEDHDGKATGIVAADLHADFKIASVEHADPNVTVSYKPMSASALKRAGKVAGYEFTATVGKGIPIGNFRSWVRIVTTLEPKTPIDIELTAVRQGPIRFLTAGNARWSSEKSLLNLGRFRHEDGIKTELSAYVYDMRGKFQLLGAKSTDSFVKVSLEPSPESATGEQQGIRFVFEVPPGSPPVNYFTQKPVHVTVQTNHPSLKTIDFDLQFVSL